MPRLPRVQVEGAIYYVTSKGVQDEKIYKDAADKKMVLDLMSKYKTQHQFKLYAYALMPDRIHLLIEPGEGATISEVMHDLNSLYTKYFNGRYDRKGPLFEARFKSLVVEKDAFLLAMTRYLHRLAQAPEALAPAFSESNSYHYYLRGNDPQPPAMLDIRQEIQEVINQLPDANAQGYAQYCRQADPLELGELEASLKRGSVLGSESFKQAVRNRIAQHQQQRQEAENSAHPSPVAVRVWVTAAGIMVMVAGVTSVYLYMSTVSLQTKYDELITQRETEFFEKTRFENRNPLALENLDGTQWDIEIFPLSAGLPQQAIRDRIRFTDGGIFSEYFSAMGFTATRYSLTPQANGPIIWETIQTNAQGDTVSWRGDWQGDAMKGIASYRPAGKDPQDFSFFSVKWAYSNASPMEAGTKS